MPRTFALSLLLCACSEYDLAGDPKTGSTTAPAPPAITTTTTTDTGTPPSLPVLECTDDYSDTMPWIRSPLWFASYAPADDDGLAWYEPDFAAPADWVPLAGLPDEDPVAEWHDAFYRAEFWLDGVAGTTEIEFVGNDGVWLYVNGLFVGHWGGDWREGGCINVPKGCGVNHVAPPIDVTPYLQAGRNVVAVMLTNGPTGFYLEINATCVE